MIETIKNWTVPNLHEDWGDTAEQLQKLQEYCIEALAKNSHLQFQLDSTEVGYMEVVIKSERGDTYLLLESGEGKMALFGEDVEVYFDTKEEFGKYMNNLK